MLLGLVIAVVVVALIFDFINGFHDTANAIATVVSTGVLPLRSAIYLAALLNFVGAFTGTAVASTIGKGIITPSTITLVVVFSALIGAIFWNLFTWYYGIPSSSSHAMVGGLIGAGLAHSGVASIQGPGLTKIVLSLVVSPILGMLVAFSLMILLYWVFRRAAPVGVAPLFRRLQMLSAGSLSRQQRRAEDHGGHHHVSRRSWIHGDARDGQTFSSNMGSFRKRYRHGSGYSGRWSSNH
jgi:PiT family inorganic phosphate transporter